MTSMEAAASRIAWALVAATDLLEDTPKDFKKPEALLKVAEMLLKERRKLEKT